jgi:hypothetical protein
VNWLIAIESATISPNAAADSATPAKSRNSAGANWFMIKA